MKLITKKIGEDWWIVGDEDYGPYETKKEAEEDRVGIGRFMRNQNDPEFMSVDSKLKEE